MPNRQTIDLDELIAKLQEIRAGHAVPPEVYVDVPWEDGVMSHAEPIKNVFFADSVVWIVPEKMKTST